MGADGLMPSRALLSNLNIGEIAFCRSGIHPGAKVVLYKKRPDPEPVAMG